MEGIVEVLRNGDVDAAKYIIGHLAIEANSSLLKAAIHGGTETVRYILSLIGSTGKCDIEYAIIHGNLETFKLIFEMRYKKEKDYKYLDGYVKLILDNMKLDILDYLIYERIGIYTIRNGIINSLCSENKAIILEHCLNNRHLMDDRSIIKPIIWHIVYYWDKTLINIAKKYNVMIYDVHYLRQATKNNEIDEVILTFNNLTDDYIPPLEEVIQYNNAQTVKIFYENGSRLRTNYYVKSPEIVRYLYDQGCYDFRADNYKQLRLALVSRNYEVVAFIIQIMTKEELVMFSNDRYFNESKNHIISQRLKHCN